MYLIASIHNHRFLHVKPFSASIVFVDVLARVIIELVSRVVILYTAAIL